jgi:phosphoribosylanthranilate isomerase
MPFKVIKAIKCDARTIRPTLQEWRAAYQAGELPNLAALLLEAPTAAAGGTGEANDFALIRMLQCEGAFDGLPGIIVAGGLRPESVASVVRGLRPYAVDVSSGIEETFGRKSPALIRRFVDEVAGSDER